MIKRTYFYSGYNKETKKGRYGYVQIRSWFPNHKKAIKLLMEDFDFIHVETFHRVK